MNKIELAEKIRTLRKSKELRQDDLAAKAGVSIRVIRDLESGTANPTIESLELVCSVLGVPLPQILMPGMEAVDPLVINTPRAIGSKDADPKNKKSDTGVLIGAISQPRANTERNENGGSETGEPPQKMPEKVNDIIHTDSSDANNESFSASRAQIILEIQALLTKLSDDDLEVVKMAAEGRLELSQSEKAIKQAKD